MFYDDKNLRKFFIQEGNDLIAYELLKEDEKVQLNKNVINQLFQSVESKINVVDNKDINATKGDIKKLKNYKYMTDSLVMLNNIQLSSHEKITNLDTLQNALDNIIKYTKEFEQGYRLNKSVIIYFYNSIIGSLVYSVSFIIATSIDYIKDPFNNYQVNLRNNLERNNQFPTIFLKCLEDFNKICVSGELDRFFVSSYDKSLNESLVTDIFGIFSVVSSQAIPLLIMIPSILRLIVSMWFNLRLKMSDYFQLQAYYIQINLNTSSNMNENTKKKQEKLVDLFIKLSDKISLDQKQASKKAEMQVNIEDRNISRNLKNNDDDNQLL